MIINEDFKIRPIVYAWSWHTFCLRLWSIEPYDVDCPDCGSDNVPNNVATGLIGLLISQKYAWIWFLFIEFKFTRMVKK